MSRSLTAPNRYDVTKAQELFEKYPELAEDVCKEMVAMNYRSQPTSPNGWRGGWRS